MARKAKASGFQHVDIRVKDFKKSKVFYGKLLGYLGFKKIVLTRGFGGWDLNGQSFWVEQASGKHKNKKFHRKNPGLNHIAFAAVSRKAIDDFHKNFLKKNRVKTLYQTPKDFPEYSKGYYAVFFEDPERIKLELAYFPKHK